MDIILNNSKKWYAVYKKLDKEEKYQYVLETLSCDLSAEYFDKIDFTGVISHAFEYLKAAKQHDKMIELYDKAYRWKENLDECFYNEVFMVDYYLYNNNIDGVKKHLDSFLSNPVKSIDIFIPLLDKLNYYGQSELVLEISIQMYSKVKNAPGLIPGSEGDFSWKIYLDKLQSIYNDLKKNVPVNKEAILEYLDKFGYDLESDIDMILDVLSPKYERMPDRKDFRKDRENFSYTLMLIFCRYMLDTKNVSFSSSGDIWDVMLRSIKAGSPGKAAEERFDNVYELDEEKYDNQISGRMGFISNKVTCGFAVAWGMVFIYDFLYKHKYISDEVYYDALEIIDGIKVEIIKGYTNSLWEYNFVHVWGKPDSIDDEQFTVEKELFDNSYETEIELVDEQTFNRILEEDNE